MHHQFAGTASLHGLRALARQAGVVKAQAHLGRHGQVGGHGTAHGGHQRGNALGLLQKRRPAAVAVDHLGGATKVQVDALGPQRRQAGRVLGHAHRVGAQQLRAHGHAGQRAPAMVQFGQVAQKHPFGQQGAGDADELGHAAVHAAHAGEHIAQHKIQKPLHGGEQQGHGAAHPPDLRRDAQREGRQGFM